MIEPMIEPMTDPGSHEEGPDAMNCALCGRHINRQLETWLARQPPLALNAKAADKPIASTRYLCRRCCKVATKHELEQQAREASLKENLRRRETREDLRKYVRWGSVVLKILEPHLTLGERYVRSQDRDLIQQIVCGVNATEGMTPPTLETLKLQWRDRDGHSVVMGDFCHVTPPWSVAIGHEVESRARELVVDVEWLKARIKKAREELSD